MHCELAIPGLFGASAEARFPALELLLARGRRARAPARSLEAWLSEAFELGDAPFPAGALTLLGSGGDPGEATWARADPMHLRLFRDHFAAVAGEAFEVRPEEADALCEALSRHFGQQLEFQSCEPRRWCARLLNDTAPDDALTNEVQMLLHAHPVNEAREARGEPTVNSLWLWGVGSTPRVPASKWQSVTAAGPVAIGLARLSGARHRALPADANTWLQGAAQEGRHLVLLDALRAPLALGQSAEYGENIEALEQRWFAPLLAALRAGRLGMISVHVPDSLGASFETIRGDLRRFWRRPKALEKYA
jgi:hypothetical protein